MASARSLPTSLGAWGSSIARDLREWDKLALVRELAALVSDSGAWRVGSMIAQVHNDSRRQSISVENTYDVDLPDLRSCLDKLPELLDTLKTRMERIDSSYRPGKPFVKVKFP